MKLEDLPKFTVAHIGGADFSLLLRGHFSKAELVHRGDCWLRMPDGFPFYATVTELEAGTGLATLESNDELRPQLVIGATAPWFDRYWGSNEVNIILDSGHNWIKTVFEATDAYERSAPDGALGSQRIAPDGRTWRPAIGAPLAGERLVKDAWNHEHCLICFTHIEPGDMAFVDAAGYWLCVDCHRRYAVPCDLGFMFPEQQRLNEPGSAALAEE